jgi:hypothetical protein
MVEAINVAQRHLTIKQERRAHQRARSWQSGHTDESGLTNQTESCRIADCEQLEFNEWCTGDDRAVAIVDRQ